MASNLPSSFASAAAGQNSNRDARGARDGRGNSSGEWYVPLLILPLLKTLSVPSPFLSHYLSLSRLPFPPRLPLPSLHHLPTL